MAQPGGGCRNHWEGSAPIGEGGATSGEVAQSEGRVEQLGARRVEGGVAHKGCFC